MSHLSCHRQCKGEEEEEEVLDGYPQSYASNSVHTLPDLSRFMAAIFHLTLSLSQPWR